MEHPSRRGLGQKADSEAGELQRGRANGARLLNAPSKIRTCDLLIRSQTLYPTELWAREGASSYQTERRSQLVASARRRTAHPSTRANHLGLLSSRPSVSSSRSHRAATPRCPSHPTPTRCTAGSCPSTGSSRHSDRRGLRGPNTESCRTTESSCLRGESYGLADTDRRRPGTGEIAVPVEHLDGDVLGRPTDGRAGEVRSDRRGGDDARDRERMVGSGRGRRVDETRQRRNRRRHERECGCRDDAKHGLVPRVP